MSDEMKVSYHNETASDTAAHNDRSLYDYAYKERDKNLHWDCYEIGFKSEDNPNGSESPSVDAEARFYEENFSGVLAETNEKYLKQGHAEKCMTMEQYRRKHPPKESIIQLGDSEDEIDDAYVRVAVEAYAKKLQSVGCKVISWDIHNDESDGTPHAHIRWIGIDSKGKPNLAACLREHGVEKAQIVWTEEEAEQHNKRAKKKVKAGDSKGAQFNNELTAFTDEVRTMLEDLAEPYAAAYAAKVSREREEGAQHLSVPEFKSKKRREEREKKLESREEQVDILAASLDSEREQMQLDFAAQQEAHRVALEEQEQESKSVVDDYANAVMTTRQKALDNAYYDRLLDAETTLLHSRYEQTEDAIGFRGTVKRILELVPQEIMELVSPRNETQRERIEQRVTSFWNKVIIPRIDDLSGNLSAVLFNERSPELNEAQKTLDENSDGMNARRYASDREKMQDTAERAERIREGYYDDDPVMGRLFRLRRELRDSHKQPNESKGEARTQTQDKPKQEIKTQKARVDVRPNRSHTRQMSGPSL